LIAGSSSGLIIHVNNAWADDITGTDSNDTLTGTINRDTISELAGDDLIKSEGGKDQVFGNGGSDELHGGNARDTIKSGPGADELFGEGSNDKLYGGTGADDPSGDKGAEYFDCGKGVDKILDFNPQRDRAYPDLGHDFYPSSQWSTAFGPIEQYVLADLYAWLEAHSGFTRLPNSMSPSTTNSSTNSTIT
jgi:RTX calcium-binding nonapeptide repeat (4 copies)